MKRVGIALCGSLALALSAGAQSATQVWDFNNPPAFDYNGYGNSWSLTSTDGVNLTVTGWSDTQDISGADDRIQDAQLIWAQTSALGIVNRDEDTGSPNHSIDSFRTGQYDSADGESDMLLLEFDTAVDLNGIDLKWARDASSYGYTDISILAWNGTGASGLAGNTWSEVLASNGGGYDSIGNYADVGLSYYGVNDLNVSSTKWLIGVYNPVFGPAHAGAANDGFKLDWIQTSTVDFPPTGDVVSAPGSLALVLLGLAGVSTRRRRS